MDGQSWLGTLIRGDVYVYGKLVFRKGNPLEITDKQKKYLETVKDRISLESRDSDVETEVISRPKFKFERKGKTVSRNTVTDTDEEHEQDLSDAIDEELIDSNQSIDDDPDLSPKAPVRGRSRTGKN